jgi:hypothetical protein
VDRVGTFLPRPALSAWEVRRVRQVRALTWVVGRSWVTVIDPLVTLSNCTLIARQSPSLRGAHTSPPDHPVRLRPALTKPGGAWRSLADVELATGECGAWFDTTRLHSAIGHLPPEEYEVIDYAQHHPSQLAGINR